MKVSKIVFAGVFAAVSTMGALAPVTSTLASNSKDHKVTICHATNSATNPYVSVTVDYNSIVRGPGHDGHNGGVAVSVAHATQLKNDKQMWGDIIPAIAEHNYPGKNLTTEGRTILANDCNFPAVVDETTPETPVTPGNPNPGQPENPGQPANPGKPENPGNPNPGNPGNGSNEKVVLCHATRSATNPYVRVDVSVNAVANKGKNGHGTHTGPVATSYEHAAELKAAGKHWGDVIPAIPSKGYAGLNLAEGQKLLDNDCRFVTPAGEVIEPTVPVEEDEEVTMPEVVVESDKTDEPGKGEVQILDAASTDQPRVAALPVTGGMNTVLIPVLGMLAAGVVYLAAPALRRLGLMA